MLRKLMSKINGRLKSPEKKESAAEYKKKQYICSSCYTSHSLTAEEFGETLKCNTCGGKLREVL